MVLQACLVLRMKPWQENICKGNTASLRNSNDREAEHRWASVESAHQCVNVIGSVAGKWHFGAHTWQSSKYLAKILHRFSQATSFLENRVSSPRSTFLTLASSLMSRHLLSPWMNEVRERRTEGRVMRATHSSPCISLRRIEYLPGDFADFELALSVFGLTRNPGNGV